MMFSRIEQMRDTLDDLEIAIKRHEIEDIEMHIRSIKNTCNEIKKEIWELEVDERPATVKKKTKQQEKHRVINTIEFLYKPMNDIDIYEGNRLELFSDERSEELKLSEAIMPHNEFWESHEIVKGNVFGSVPCELLSADSSRMLQRCGWRKVDVDIIDFRYKFDQDQGLFAYCEDKFEHYLLVLEKQTSANLLLRFKF